MKKLLGVLLFLLAYQVARAQVPQYTPNLNLELPPRGFTNWDTVLNSNFTILDTAVAAKLSVTGAVTPGDCAVFIDSTHVQDGGGSCGGGGGGSSIFTSFVFGTNAAITGTGKYLQLTASALFSLTQSGTGIFSNPYLDTINLSSQTANCVIASPNGSSGVPTCRALVAADVPALSYVTSIGLAVPSWLAVSGSPVNSAGTLTITAQSGQSSHQVIGTCNTATSFTPCSLVAGDLPNLGGDVTGAYGSSVVGKLNGTSLAGLATGILKNMTGTGVPSIAGVADVDTLYSGAGKCYLFKGSTPGSNDGCDTPAGAGIINNAAQYDATYYSASGTTNTLSGAVISGFQYDSTTGAPVAATASQAAALIQGLTGCNTASNVFTPQASDCVPQSGSPAGSTYAVQYNAGGGAFGGANPTSSPNSVPCVWFTLYSAGSPTAPQCQIQGVPVNATLGTTPYSMAVTDRAALLLGNPSSPFTINLPNGATSGFGNNFVSAFKNYGTAAFTLTAPGGINLNGVLAGSLPLPGNWTAWMWQDASNNLWLSRLPDFSAFPVSCTNPIGFTSASGAFPCLTLTGAMMANNTVTATQLAAQYSKWRGCEGRGLGDGLNAIPAGTYLQTTCYNDTGVTVTITGIKCFSDNSGTSTLNASGHTLGALLTAAVTCTPSYASGTQSANVLLTAGDYIQFTFVADGTSKQTDWVVTGTF